MTCNKMTRVFTIGEMFYDITFRENIPVSANPGGAMLNTAVSLARCAIDVTLLSEFSTDYLGDLIKSFLELNGVNTANIFRHELEKTPLALAFLDERNDAKYVFYEICPSERLHADNPVFTKGDIVLFGSLMALSEHLRPKILNILEIARKAGAILLYDPNLRESVLNCSESVNKLVRENISLADLVRGSHRDFELAFGKEDVDEVYECVKRCGCNSLIYTRDSKGVWLKTDHYHSYYPITSVKIVSTVGAGDSFNAGLIYSMLAFGPDFGPDKCFTEWENKFMWGSIIGNAISFATHTCAHTESYITKDFASLLKVENYED